MSSHFLNLSHIYDLPNRNLSSPPASSFQNATTPELLYRPGSLSTSHPRATSYRRAQIILVMNSGSPTATTPDDYGAPPIQVCDRRAAPHRSRQSCCSLRTLLTLNRFVRSVLKTAMRSTPPLAAIATVLAACESTPSSRSNKKQLSQ
jgi:hypothetical protein